VFGPEKDPRLSVTSKKPTLGIALGSGASRGWSHVGVIDALADAGIEPDVVCGTSVGAMVGASYASGRLEVLRDWVQRSSRTDVFRFFDIRPTNAGFVDLDRFLAFLHECVAPEDTDIESLDKTFAAVATDLDTGREVWCQEGRLAHAVRASMAMPGLFPAVRDEDRWLVDGGLVDPVPVSVCRALGADVVIGVNLNADIIGKHRRRAEAEAEADKAGNDGVLGNLRKQAREYSSTLFPNGSSSDTPPGLLYVIPSSINIFQDRITRNRLVGDPADVLIAPKVGHIGILEFQHAREAMQIGRDATEALMGDIRRAADGY
jgi:NTE family protein